MSPSVEARASAGRDPAARIIFDDAFTTLFYRPARSSMLVATFNPAVFPAGPHAFWGVQLAQKLRCAALGFVSKSVNWFPPASIEAAAAAAAPVLAGFSHVFTYGFSLGGYGALKYGRLLGADFSLAFSPQSPTVRAGIPNSLEAQAPHLYLGRDVGPDDVAPRAYIVYDPLHEVDQRSVRVVLDAGTKCVLFHTYGTGHHSLRPFLKGLDRLIEACRSGDRAQFAALWAEVRRNHPGRGVALAGFLARRRPALAAEIHRRFGDRFEPLQTAELHLDLAVAWLHAGRPDAARQAIEAASPHAGDEHSRQRLANVLGAHARAAQALSAWSEALGADAL